MFVIVRRSGRVAVWLTSTLPVRWGDKAVAMQFQSRGEARRAAAAMKLHGDWSVELAANAPK